MVAERARLTLAKNYAVGMVFLSQNEEKRASAAASWKKSCKSETLSIVGWREMPTNPDVLGEIALSPCRASSKSSSMPGHNWRPRDMERRLFVAPPHRETRAGRQLYVCSFSTW